MEIERPGRRLQKGRGMVNIFIQNQKGKGEIGDLGRATAASVGEEKKGKGPRGHSTKSTEKEGKADLTDCVLGEGGEK